MTNDSYELKYCELCGALGLRRSKSETSYCPSCRQMLQDFLLTAIPQTRSHPTSLLRPLYLWTQEIAPARSTQPVIGGGGREID